MLPADNRIFLSFFRFFVRFGNAGMIAVDFPARAGVCAGLQAPLGQRTDDHCLFQDLSDRSDLFI